MPDDTINMPEITAAMLEDYGAETLGHALQMLQGIQHRTPDGNQIVSLLNNTLITHFEEMVKKSRLTRDEAAPLSSKEDAELCDSMYLHITNIAAAALALRPFFKAAAQVSAARVVELHQVN